jgi:hypothetical protein
MLHLALFTTLATAFAAAFGGAWPPKELTLEENHISEMAQVLTNSSSVTTRNLDRRQDGGVRYDL